MPDNPPDPPVDLGFLSGTPVFGGFEKPALALVAEHLERRRLPAGSRVVAEGDGAREMFVVESGEVEVVVHRPPPGEGELVLARLSRGDCFGEMSLLDVQPRSATVTTLSDASLLVLPYRELLALKRRDADAFLLLVLNVAREVSRRLRVCHGLLLEALAASGRDHREAEEVLGSRRP